MNIEHEQRSIRRWHCRLRRKAKREQAAIKEKMKKRRLQLKADSATRFQYVDVIPETDESDLEQDSSLYIMLLNKVAYPKFKKKVNFADFYKLVTEGRRSVRAK